MSSSSLKSNILSDFGFTETPEVERFLSHGIKKKFQSCRFWRVSLVTCNKQLFNDHIKMLKCPGDNSWKAHWVSAPGMAIPVYFIPSMVLAKLKKPQALGVFDLHEDSLFLLKSYPSFLYLLFTLPNLRVLFILHLVFWYERPFEDWLEDFLPEKCPNFNFQT